ncbi:MAG: MotA/TolQ/ExbB proton channel family protein [Deltaproteobacteria bacterium]|nr:MotA/TolQ/ExbB proton channel family protein [Deltaproteobacteria bacterium]MBW2106830.1 MotA/TolQ/ExbB proton channel family protein [Deltaproteobacteria bacterium]RLB21123.1 MAG: MotA/TolQ/ExbB proton channel family protein [Deltaproteobacteria bacterium]RLJ04105.1 MAG: MotA/TolQ/ExbB proton channel family protein [Candidatus Aenigmarchaeota archaeon]
MDVILETYDYLRPGGIVMIPIILTSLWMWALIIERLFYLRRMRHRDISLKEAVEILQGKDISSLSDGLMARIVIRFIKEKVGQRDLDRNIINQCAMKERPLLRRYLAAITVLAAVAPLLGLLGTVTGMITTFNVISIFGTGNARAMAGGISEALITTQSGLLVAIPGLFMSNFLARRFAWLENSLDELAMTLRRYV